MILETSVEKILRAFESAERVTAKNTSLGALGTILFIVKGNIAKIRATNLSIGVEFEIPVVSDGDGVVALDGKIVCGFLNSIPKNEKIKISLQETTLTLVTKNNRTTVKTYPYEDFPTLPTVSGVSFTLPKNNFIKGVKSVSFAAAVSDIKPEIATVCLIPEKNTLFFVATDSFRLAEKKEVISKPIDFSPILIPNKNVIEIVKILEPITEDIQLIISENQISFTTPSIYITSRVITGSFPDYKQIIPKAFSTEAVLLKQDIVNILRSANIFSDKFNQITLLVNPQKKKFECIAKNTDIGEYSGILNATLSGDEVSLSVNYQYLTDVLSIIPQDSISIGFNGPNKALVIKGVGDASFIYLLQPMNR